MRRTFIPALSAVLLSLALILPQPVFAAIFDLTETPTSDGGQYTLTNNTDPVIDPLYVYGLLVGNSSSTDTLVGRYNWNSRIITAEQWNTGIVLQWGGPGLPEPITLLDTSLLGPFSSFFGSATHANTYWFGNYLAAPIGPGETEDQFFWLEGAIESEYLILGEGTNDFLARSLAPSEVPLPAALPLFAAGLGVMGLLRLRRRKRTGVA